MGKLLSNKRTYTSQIGVANIRKGKRYNMTDENENSLKTICKNLCEDPSLFSQLDEETVEVTIR
jgi:hypothetical protein